MAEVRAIPLVRIEPDQSQPRKLFDGEAEIAEPLDGVDPTPEEAALADQLLASLAQSAAVLDVQQDGYRAALVAMIDAKLTGLPAPEEQAPPAAKAPDLLAALKASIEGRASEQQQELVEAAKAGPEAQAKTQRPRKAKDAA